MTRLMDLVPALAEQLGVAHQVDGLVPLTFREGVGGPKPAAPIPPRYDAYAILDNQAVGLVGVGQTWLCTTHYAAGATYATPIVRVDLQALLDLDPPLLEGLAKHLRETSPQLIEGVLGAVPEPVRLVPRQARFSKPTYLADANPNHQQMGESPMSDLTTDCQGCIQSGRFATPTVALGFAQGHADRSGHTVLVEQGGLSLTIRKTKGQVKP